MKVVLHPKQHESLVRHEGLVRGVGPFWGLMDIQFAQDIILVVKDAIASSTIYF